MRLSWQFIELEVVKAIENDSGELEGIKWECIYVNIDSISYYKLANEVLRPYNKENYNFMTIRILMKVGLLMSIYLNQNNKMRF